MFAPLSSARDQLQTMQRKSQASLADAKSLKQQSRAGRLPSTGSTICLTVQIARPTTLDEGKTANTNNAKKDSKPVRGQSFHLAQKNGKRASAKPTAFPNRSLRRPPSSQACCRIANTILQFWESLNAAGTLSQ